MQHSPTAAALSASFLLNHASQKPQAKCIDYRIHGSYSSVSMSRESKRLKKLSSDLLNSGNALIRRVKNAIFVFPVLPGNAEAQVI